MTPTLGFAGMEPSAAPTPRIDDDLTRPGPGDRDDDSRLARLVAATSRYCVDTWLPQALPAVTAAVPDEGTARPVSAAALSLAVAVRCGALDGGVTPERAVGEAVRAVRACSAGHVTSGGSWGRTWQAPLVSAQLGLAAWLLDEALPADVRAAAQQAVRDEAVLLCGTPLRYLRDAQGRLVTPGNTGAEEESWRARGLSTAAAMLPRDAQARRWLRWQVLRQLAAYATPSDVARTDLLHRAPVCAWLAGSNMEPDGDLQNHGFLPQPNYMRPVHSLVAVTQQRLAGQAVSPSALNGVEQLYAALRRYYREDGGLDYPDGTDVPNRTVMLYANDALHRALGLGGQDAVRWERVHGDIAERQVQPDGSVHEPGGVELFGPVQPDIAAKLAECLLASRLGPLRDDEVDGVRLAGPPQQEVPTGCTGVTHVFPDTSGDVAAAASWLHARGVLQGRADGTFAPDRPVDRATAVLSLFRIAGAPSTAAPHGFPDVPADGGDLDRAVRWGVATGVVRGTAEGRFDGSATLTRGQAVLLLWRQEDRPQAPSSGFADVEGEVAAAAAWAREAGVTRGRTPTSFDPAAPLTRGDWARMLHRLHAVG
jgi:hypothetical protein